MTNFGRNYTFRFNNQKVYVLLGNSDLTWQEAESSAQSLGGHLVTINDAVENHWIVDNFGTEAIWIGLNDVDHEGVFQWSSGEEVTYTSWADFEPNNYLGNQDYAYINYRNHPGIWDDSSGDQRIWGLAEIDFSGNAPEIISNGGAAEVRLEIAADTSFVTDVDAIDADGDTEGNGLHYSIVGGNFADAFTIDADTGELSFKEPADSGILYDVEVKVSDSGQLEFSHLPHGAKFYNGHAYVVLDNPNLTWEEAQAHAQSLGGNLVTINDAAEEQWIKHAFSDHEEFWIGLTDKAHEGDFRWVSGEAVTYTNWADFEPNDYLGHQDYAVMNWGAHRQWDDQGSEQRHWALVEIEPTRGASLMDTQRILVTVIDNNQAPVANDDFYEVNEDEAIFIENAAFGILENDTDPDNDSLVVSAVEGENFSESIILEGSDGGIFEIYFDGSFNFDPNFDFDYLAEEETQDTSVEYTIDDGNGGTDTAILNITVVGQDERPINGDPVAIDDSAVVESGTQVGIRVLDNDFDPDGDGIRIDFPNTDKTSANRGIIRWNQNGTPDDFSDDRLVYIPAARFTGTDTFEYAIADGRGGTATATVTVIVFQGNGPFPPTQHKIILEGTNDDDLLVAESSRADYDIRGLAGNDTLIGNDGDDCLVGSSGNDDLFGGDRNDALNGTDDVSRGIGEWDVLMGGEGQDTFIIGDERGSYYLGNGTSDFVLIKDFDLEQDKLELAGSRDDYEFRGNEIYLGDDLVVNFIGVQATELTDNNFEDNGPDQSLS